MGVLRAVSIALALAGCYSPELAERAVACSAEADCGDGQTCNAEGLCASAGVSCRASGDAAVTADAPVEPDAPPPQTTLRIHVMDRGEVRLAGHAPCTMEDDCLVLVDSGERVTLTAEPLEDRVFDKWEEACAGQPTKTCTLTPTGTEVRVTAKFKRMP